VILTFFTVPAFPVIVNKPEDALDIPVLILIVLVLELPDVGVTDNPFEILLIVYDVLPINLTFIGIVDE
jgi:hypothetical protein